MYYFAYGSNMSLARLRRRVPSALRVAVACLAAHRIHFHKIGLIDGSGKCGAEYTGELRDRIWGVVYRIAQPDQEILDIYEGAGIGYQRVSVEVTLTSGEIYPSFTYLATRVGEGLLPFTWYKHHVLIGARENALPAEYIGMLETVKARLDDDPQRHRREMAIHSSRHPSTYLP